LDRIFNKIFNSEIHHSVLLISLGVIGLHTTAEYTSEGFGEAFNNFFIGIIIWVCGVGYGAFYTDSRYEVKDK
jgi:hypothetical protein